MFLLLLKYSEISKFEHKIRINTNGNINTRSLFNLLLFVVAILEQCSGSRLAVERFAQLHHDRTTDNSQVSFSLYGVRFCVVSYFLSLL